MRLPMKALSALIRETIHASALVASITILLFLTGNIIAEVETFQEPDYSDVKGCTKMDFYYSNCT